jgi:hypothetical protein
MTDFTPTTETRHPSRRSVIAAGAWAAPAIVMTVASPAHAASTPPAPEPSGAIMGYIMWVHDVEWVSGVYQIPADTLIKVDTAIVATSNTTYCYPQSTVTMEIVAGDATLGGSNTTSTGTTPPHPQSGPIYRSVYTFYVRSTAPSGSRFTVRVSGFTNSGAPAVPYEQEFAVL